MSGMAPLRSARDAYSLAMGQAYELRRSKRFAEAAEAFQQASSQAEDDHDALLMHAVTLKEAGHFNLANGAFRQMLDEHPSSALGWSLYGVFLRNIEKYEEAISPLRKSLSLKDDIATRNALVVTLYKGGLVEEAREEGRLNLEKKDDHALRRFEKSRSQLAISRRTLPPFNPKERHKNIISFSLWGDNPTYVHGAIANARIAQHIYYGWTTRFYCDSSVPPDAIQELQRAGAQIVLVQDPWLDRIRPMWRFLVSDDPNVDWFVCRDADSRLNCQELIAVEEWLRSGKPFHVMRDHIYHMELILAGMWGGAARVLPNLRAWLMGSQEYFDNRFADQAFLMYEVWPLVRDHICAHDTYYRFRGAGEFPTAYRLPFPVHVGGAIKRMPHWRR